MFCQKITNLLLPYIYYRPNFKKEAEEVLEIWAFPIKLRKMKKWASFEKFFGFSGNIAQINKKDFSGTIGGVLWFIYAASKFLVSVFRRENSPIIENFSDCATTWTIHVSI